MQLQQIRGELRNLRSAIRRIFLAEGVMRLCAMAIILFLALMALDYFINFPVPVRTVLLLGSLVYLGIQVYWNVFYPLVRPITEEDIAIAIEHHFPELRERLISSMQLSEKLDDPATSKALVRALVQEMENYTDKLNFKEIIKPENIGKVAGLAIAMLLVISIFAVMANNIFNSAVRRLLMLSDIPYPAQTYVFLEEPADLAAADDKRITIAHSSPVTIRYRCEGREPKEVEIYMLQDKDMVSNAEWQVDKMKFEEEMSAGGNAFFYTYHIPKVTVSFEFYAKVKGTRVLDPMHYFLDVDYPPDIQTNTVKLWYKYPEYTHKAETDPSKPEYSREVRALIGTQVTIEAVSTQDLTKAEIELVKDNDLGEEIVYEKYDMEVKQVKNSSGDMEPRLVRGTFAVKETGDYRIILHRESLNNKRNPFKGTVVAEPDFAPEFVSVTSPSSRQTILTARGNMPIQMRIDDDYGIKKMMFNYSVTKQAKTPAETTPPEGDKPEEEKPEGGEKPDEKKPEETGEPSKPLTSVTQTFTRELKFGPAEDSEFQYDPMEHACRETLESRFVNLDFRFMLVTAMEGGVLEIGDMISFDVEVTDTGGNTKKSQPFTIEIVDPGEILKKITEIAIKTQGKIVNKGALNDMLTGQRTSLASDLERLIDSGKPATSDIKEFVRRYTNDQGNVTAVVSDIARKLEQVVVMVESNGLMEDPNFRTDYIEFKRFAEIFGNQANPTASLEGRSRNLQNELQTFVNKNDFESQKQILENGSNTLQDIAGQTKNLEGFLDKFIGFQQIVEMVKDLRDKSKSWLEYYLGLKD